MDTKQKIIEAAIQVFNGDFSAPLEKVAEKAEVTRRTLHRYFQDRNNLVKSCERDMEISCRKAIIAALDSSREPLVKLENMLYAGVDCGAKYSFLYKLHQKEGRNHYPKTEGGSDYDYIYARFKKLIVTLQNKNIINRHMTPEWIQILYASIVATTVNAEALGSVAKANIKKFAWVSFIKGISA